jgi:hypothetical protein
MKFKLNLKVFLKFVPDKKWDLFDFYEMKNTNSFFKSISKNIFQENVNFEKYFSKIIRVKVEF